MNHNIYIEYEEFVRGAVNKEKFLTENVLKFAYNYLIKMIMVKLIIKK